MGDGRLRVPTGGLRHAVVTSDGDGRLRIPTGGLRHAVVTSDGDGRLRIPTGGLRHAVGPLRRTDGGEGGIRTLGTLASTTVFETVPFDHSGTSPYICAPYRLTDIAWNERKTLININVKHACNVNTIPAYPGHRQHFIRVNQYMELHGTHTRLSFCTWFQYARTESFTVNRGKSQSSNCCSVHFCSVALVSRKRIPGKLYVLFHHELVTINLCKN